MRGLTKTYGDFTAVRALDLDIAAGEFIALLGPSGSGKTTTLMLVAGFLAATAGTVSLGGARVDALPPHRRPIGMVFQQYALFPHMTVRENVEFPLQMRRMPAAERNALCTAALEMVQLEGLSDRYPSQLSGGQQQRVAVARATVYRPPLLLMDEPLGALDKKIREHMQLEIRRIHRELGVTVLYVTHDQSEALTMADRIAVFRDGELQQVGPPPEVHDRPSNAFVADFIGDTSFVAGQVRDVDGRRVSVALPDGSVVAATRNEGQAGFAPGEQVSVAVRPDRVTVGGAEDAGVPGRVADVVYEGGTLRLLIALQFEAVVSARVRANALPASVERGSDVAVRWGAEDACVYAGEDR